MKKFTILLSFSLFIMFCFTNIVTAQNLVTNGDLESWTDGTPDNWDHVENITQESTVIHGGTYSAAHQSASSTKDFGHEYITGIVEGDDYDLSYYYLDNDNHARTRLWAKWKDASGSTVGATIETAFSTDDPDWQHYTNTITAPAGATQFYFEVRVYKEDNGDYGGFVYYDDVTFENAGAATPAISKAYSISNTAMDVVYNIDVTSVNAGDYSLTGTSAITFSGATIDGANAKIVHLTGASANMTGDNTVDNIDDAANTTDFDFYAGIMPISYTNTTNPSGIIDNSHLASYVGIISANDAYNNVWISDAAGERNGVLIYDYNFDGLVNVGDEVLMTATRDVYSSLTELVTPELISTNSTGNSPYGPTIIDGSDIDENIAVDTDPGEKWEGQLVTIEDFTVDSYTDYDYVCSWSDATTTYHFHIGDNVDYQFNNISLNIGETYAEITGVIDWYNPDYYRINPRDQSDVVAGEVTTATITFIVYDTTDQNYDGFFLKGSWDSNGYYDPSWGGGIEHSPFYDDGTNGDITADDHIWTCQQELIVDGGSNTWEWGINDTEHNWIAGNWQFTIPDDLPQELSWNILMEPVAEFVADATTIYVGETVNFTDLSEGYIDSWSWTFDGGTPGTSNQQTPPGIVYDVAGTYTVTLTVENEAGSSTNTKTDYINVEPVWIPENDQRQFNIYPNPNNGNFFVEFKNNSEKEIKIYSLVGKMVYHKIVNEMVSEINLSQFNNGIYFIKVYNKNSKLFTTKKLVIQ